jgi:hypothetical protein
VLPHRRLHPVLTPRAPFPPLRWRRCGDLAGRGILLLDRCRHGGGIFIDFAHARGDLPDGFHRRGGRILHGEDVIGDVLGCFCSLHGQRFDLGSNDREALTGFAGACSLDCGVESQQVCLARDTADQFDHIADFLSAICQAADLAIGGPRFVGGESHNVVSEGELAADLADGTRQLIGGNRCRFHIGRCFIEGVHRALGALRCVFGGTEERAGGRSHRRGAGAHA